MRFFFAAVLATLTTPAFAGYYTESCVNIDPLIKQNPPIVTLTFKGDPNAHGASSTTCAFAPKNAGACVGAGPGGSLSVPVSGGITIRTETPVPDTVTPQHQVWIFWNDGFGNSEPWEPYPPEPGACP
jgi:hypothetical protein